jgi:hypothetical protein
MNHPRLTRALRISWTVAWGVAALLLICLWVRSYWTMDSIVLRQKSVTYLGIVCISDYAGCVSNRGQLFLFSYGASALPTLSGWSYENEKATKENLTFTTYGFGVERTWLLGNELAIPHWFTVFVSTAVGAICWLPCWSNRFGLRTLLILMTLAASGLGIIIWLTR